MAWVCIPFTCSPEPGGGILGDLLLGHTPICAVEKELYPRTVLLQRQLDGVFPVFPIWDDITTFRSDNPESGEMFNVARGIQDNLVLCGGFPCQDISVAGRGEGINGERSGLWKEMARVIREMGPRYVFVENSPALTFRGLGTVLGDLAEMGFDAEWGVLGACDSAWYSGTPAVYHDRFRIWIVAESTNAELRSLPERRRTETAFGDVRHGIRIPQNVRPSCGVETAKGIESSNSTGKRRRKEGSHCQRSEERTACVCNSLTGSSHANFSRREKQYTPDLAARSGVDPRTPTEEWAPSWWEVEPDVGRVADGVPFRSHRLKSIGNAQVPLVAALAWNILSGER